jgi:peptidoglycan/LPS O-acetylase OafA/YrhL
MGITYVVVRHLLHFNINFLCQIANTADRMLMFFIALFLYCFSISNLRSRISIASISTVMLAFFLVCVWTIWESSDTWEEWLYGVYPSIARLACDIAGCLRSAVMTFRKCFHSATTDNVGSVPDSELAVPRDHGAADDGT